jgi:hypothetical protein
MKRGVVVLAVLALAGCTQSTAHFKASIIPTRGSVPFEATITATDIGDSYTFYLPDETIVQASPILVVTVDALDWTATVETTYGGRTYTDDVHATGSNASPEIYGLIISGNKNRWYLTPRERTLLEFSVSSDARVVDVDVWGSEYSNHYTVFTPPYDGSYHAVYLGRYVENACIVYPLYQSIPSQEPSGLPYAPTALETGYPYLSYTNTNAMVALIAGGKEHVVEIPAQTGYLRVTAENSVNLRTTETFTVPIEACDFGDLK